MFCLIVTYFTHFLSAPYSLFFLGHRSAPYSFSKSLSSKGSLFETTFTSFVILNLSTLFVIFKISNTIEICIFCIAYLTRFQKPQHFKFSTVILHSFYFMLTLFVFSTIRGLRTCLALVFTNIYQNFVHFSLNTPIFLAVYQNAFCLS